MRAVRAASLKSILDNYTVLQELWEVSKNDSTDPSMKAQIIGVQTKFSNFKFYLRYSTGLFTAATYMVVI